MTTKMGTVDRALRLIVGLALIVAPLMNYLGLGASSAVAYTLMTIGGILTLTSVFGVCPIYSLLGIQTKS